MGFFMWILFGFIVGWAANIVMNTRRRGLFKNIIVGLLGALIGGWLGTLAGVGTITEFSFQGFLMATLGAIILIAVLRTLRVT
jgi:uncharacterized membrane protein YeaQ/YmgE (transglycosylase-associated protein family)